MNSDDDSMPVEDLITSVRNAVAQSGLSPSAGDRDLQVESVQLTLRVVASKSAGAGLDFRVPFLGMKIFGGAKLTKQDTHTIGILLQPAARPAARAVLGGNPIEVALASAIATIRAAMATAAAGEDPLAIGSGTVTLEFAIERNGQVSLGAEGGLGQEVTHTLVLTLVPPAPATGHAGAASSAP